MSIVLGFGSTEKDFEAAEEEAIGDEIVRRLSASPADVSYYTDAFVEGFRLWLNERAKALQADAARYKNADDHPDRYSSYYPWVVADASHIICILRFHHINRRHPMSPDGWGLFCSKAIFDFAHADMLGELEQAA